MDAPEQTRPPCRFDQRPVELILRTREHLSAGGRSSPYLPIVAGSISTIAAIATVWAAWEAHKAAAASQAALELGARTSRASLWQQVLGEWGHESMLEAAQSLRLFQREHGDAMADEFLELLTNQTLAAPVANIDRHRRRVVDYLGRLQVLCDHELIERDFVVLQFSHIHPFMRDVIVPLELAKNRHLRALNAVTDADVAACRRQCDAALNFWAAITAERRLLDSKQDAK